MGHEVGDDHSSFHPGKQQNACVHSLKYHWSNIGQHVKAEDLFRVPGRITRSRLQFGLT